MICYAAMCPTHVEGALLEYLNYILVNILSFLQCVLQISYGYSITLCQRIKNTFLHIGH